MRSSTTLQRRCPRHALKLRKLPPYRGRNRRHPASLTLNVRSSRHYSPNCRLTQGSQCETALCYFSFTTPELVFKRQQISRLITCFSSPRPTFSYTEKQTNREVIHWGRKLRNCFKSSLTDARPDQSLRLPMAML